MFGRVADSDSEAGLLIGPVLYQELSHMFASLAFAIISLNFSADPIHLAEVNSMIIGDYVSTGLGAFLRYLLNGSRISVLFQFRDNYGQLDSNLVFWHTDLGEDF